MTSQFDISWHDRKREPQVAPDPNYPDGIDLDLSMGGPSCKTRLSYPARRCGYYTIHCRRCHYRAIVTTAGRPDDPRSVKLPCRGKYA